MVWPPHKQLNGCLLMKQPPNQSVPWVPRPGSLHPGTLRRGVPLGPQLLHALSSWWSLASPGLTRATTHTVSHWSGRNLRATSYCDGVSRKCATPWRTLPVGHTCGCPSPACAQGWPITQGTAETLLVSLLRLQLGLSLPCTWAHACPQTSRGLCGQ